MANEDIRLSVGLDQASVNRLKRDLKDRLSGVPIGLDTTKKSVNELKRKISTSMGPIKVQVVADQRSVVKLRSQITKTLGNIPVRVNVQDLNRIRKITQDTKFNLLDRNSVKALAALRKDIEPALRFSKGDARRFIVEANSYFKNNPVTARVQFAREGGAPVAQATTTTTTGAAVASGRAAQETRDYAKATSKAEGQTQKLGKAIDNTNERLNSFTERIGFSATRLAAYIVPAAAFFQMAQAIQFAKEGVVELNRESVKLSQILGNNTERARGLAQEVLGISTELGSASRELLQTTTLIAQAGEKFRSNQDILATIEGLGKSQLAATFGTLEETTSGVIAALNQFNLEGRETIRVLDVANELSKRFAVQAGDIFTAVERGGGTFAAAGGNLEQFAAIVATIREATGLAATNIGTNLNTVISKFLTPKNITLIEELTRGLGGIRDAEGDLIGITDIILRLGEAINTLDTEGQFDIISQLSDKRTNRILIPLLNNTDKLRAALQATEEAAGSTSRDAVEGLDRIDVQLRRVTSSIDELLLTFANDDGVKQFFKTTADGLVAISEALQLITPVLPLIAGLGLVKLGQYFTTGGGASALVKGAGLYSPGRFATARRLGRVSNDPGVTGVPSGTFINRTDSAGNKFLSLPVLGPGGQTRSAQLGRELRQAESQLFRSRQEIQQRLKRIVGNDRDDLVKRSQRLGGVESGLVGQTLQEGLTQRQTILGRRVQRNQQEYRLIRSIVGGAGGGAIDPQQISNIISNAKDPLQRKNMELLFRKSLPENIYKPGVREDYRRDAAARFLSESGTEVRQLRRRMKDLSNTLGRQQAEYQALQRANTRLAKSSHALAEAQRKAAAESVRVGGRSSYISRRLGLAGRQARRLGGRVVGGIRGFAGSDLGKFGGITAATFLANEIIDRGFDRPDQDLSLRNLNKELNASLANNNNRSLFGSIATGAGGGAIFGGPLGALIGAGGGALYGAILGESGNRREAIGRGLNFASQQTSIGGIGGALGILGQNDPQRGWVSRAAGAVGNFARDRFITGDLLRSLPRESNDVRQALLNTEEGQAVVQQFRSQLTQSISNLSDQRLSGTDLTNALRQDFIQSSIEEARKAGVDLSGQTDELSKLFLDLVGTLGHMGFNIQEMNEEGIKAVDIVKNSVNSLSRFVTSFASATEELQGFNQLRNMQLGFTSNIISDLGGGTLQRELPQELAQSIVSSSTEGIRQRGADLYNTILSGAGQKTIGRLVNESNRGTRALTPFVGNDELRTLSDLDVVQTALSGVLQQASDFASSGQTSDEIKKALNENTNKAFNALAPQIETQEGRQALQSFVRDFTQRVDPSTLEDPLALQAAIESVVQQFEKLKLDRTQAEIEQYNNRIREQNILYEAHQQVLEKQINLDERRNSLFLKQLAVQEQLGASNESIIGQLTQRIQGFETGGVDTSSLGQLSNKLRFVLLENQGGPGQFIQNNERYNDFLSGYNKTLEENNKVTSRQNQLLELNNELFRRVTQEISSQISSLQNVGKLSTSDRFGLRVNRGRAQSLFGGFLSDLNEQTGQKITSPQQLLNRFRNDPEAFSRLVQSFPSTGGGQIGLEAIQALEKSGAIDFGGFGSSSDIAGLITFLEGLKEFSGAGTPEQLLDLARQQAEAARPIIDIEREQLTVLHQINESIRTAFNLPTTTETPQPSPSTPEPRKESQPSNSTPNKNQTEDDRTLRMILNEIHGFNDQQNTSFLSGMRELVNAIQTFQQKLTGGKGESRVEGDINLNVNGLQNAGKDSSIMVAIVKGLLKHMAQQLRAQGDANSRRLAGIFEDAIGRLGE